MLGLIACVNQRGTTATDVGLPHSSSASNIKPSLYRPVHLYGATTACKSENQQALPVDMCQITMPLKHSRWAEERPALSDRLTHSCMSSSQTREVPRAEVN